MVVTVNRKVYMAIEAVSRISKVTPNQKTAKEYDNGLSSLVPAGWYSVMGVEKRTLIMHPSHAKFFIHDMVSNLRASALLR